MLKIRQKISDDPNLGLEREVVINMITFNLRDKMILFYYSIVYLKDGKEVELNLISPEYWVVDNSYKVHIRDSEMKMIPNPEYDKEFEGSEEFLTEFAFDYFIKSLGHYAELIQNYILVDDGEGRFNPKKKADESGV